MTDASPQTDQREVLRDDADGIATLTLNRPAAYNTLSRRVMAAMQAEIDAIAEDRSVRLVVIAANGPAFCAGHDLREMRADPTEAAQSALFADCAQMMQGLTRLPQPVIARVHAVAAAAGCQLVAACDLAIAATTAKFATPGVNLGLFCTTPGVAVARTVPRKQAFAMLATGDMVTAEDAVAMGLINQAVAPDALDSAVAALAARLMAKSPLTLAIGKKAFYRQLDMSLADAYGYASRIMVENMMTHDAQAGIDAFLAKRPPRWEGR